jgi:probable F420-dependent oxidoreductase
MEGMMYPVPFAQPDDLVRITKKAEELGYYSVWGNDHMTTQQYVREGFSAPPNFWEILITYAALSTVTETIRFGTGMLVTPMRRDIVVVAKQVATLDQFSKGRLMLGVGVGAYREEFEAINPDLTAHRGNMVEESLQALRCLYNQRLSSYKGKYYHFEDVEMFPKPYQDPLPLYVGGNSPAAISRTAKYAHGWMPAALEPSQVRSKTARLQELCEEYGRDYREIDVAIQYMACIGKTREEAVKTFRESQMYHHVLSLHQSTLKDHDLSQPEDWNLIGTADQVIAQAKELEEAGVKHLCGLYFVGNTVDEVIHQMDSFASGVMPALYSS